jgi:hypothetical protein
MTISATKIVWISISTATMIPPSRGIFRPDTTK